MDAWAYFRFTSLSILLGFAFFSLSYATWVWRRRQGQKPTDHSLLWSLLARGSRGVLLAGLALAVISYIICEVVPIRGVMQLHESYAARARADVGIEYMAPVGPVAQGDLLVRFAPANQAAEAAILQAKYDQLTAELDKTKAMPLEIDEELTRAHQNALSTIEQSQAALNNMIPLLKETLRIGLEKHLERVEKYVVMDRYLIDFKATHNQSVSEYEVKYKEFQRTSKLATSEGVVTPQELELKRHEAVSMAEQVSKLEKSIQQLQREAEQYQTNNTEFGSLISEQAKALTEDVHRFEKKLQLAEQQLEAAEAAIQRDHERASRQRDAEIRMLVAEMNEVQAGLRSLKEANELFAPHDGEVVYRSSAPSSVDEHGVVLVMAKQSTAEVQFSLPRNQLEALKQANNMDIWVEDSVLAKRLSGKVLHTVDSPFQNEHAIVSVVCRPPMDLVPLLANEQLVPIQMTWHPPILTVPLFQLSLALVLLGTCGTVLQWLKQPVRQNLTLEIPAETLTGEFPEAPPQDLNQFGLHHGSTGAMLQLLGNRLRESIFDEAVDEDLIASVQWALDRHQWRGVKMIRQGFLNFLTPDENLPQRLETSLTQIEEQGLLAAQDLEQLHQILKTLHVYDEAPIMPA